MPADKLLRFHVKEYGSPASRKVIFLFCPFAVPSWQLALPGLPIWHMRRAGYSVIAYDYGLDIATISATHTGKYIKAIMADADERLSKLDDTIGVACFGSSMGTVLAVKFATQHGRIRSVVLNLCYSDIVEHILHLPFTIFVPPSKVKKYVSDGGGEEGLHKVFDVYSPLYLVEKLVGTRVLLYLAQRDRIHHRDQTAALVAALRKSKVTLEYHESKYLGHYAAALINHLDARRYMRFLR